MFRKHFQDFFGETGSKLRKPRERSSNRCPLDKIQKDEENMLEQDKTRFDRGATPGRTLISNLKPAPPRNSDVFEVDSEPKCDLKQHFKEFMSTTNKKDSSVARARLVYFAIMMKLIEYVCARNLNLTFGNSAICLGSMIFFKWILFTVTKS